MKLIVVFPMLLIALALLQGLAVFRFARDFRACLAQLILVLLLIGAEIAFFMMLQEIP